MRLPPSKHLDMRQGMCPYLKEHCLGLPCRLGQLRGGPSLLLRHPWDALNLRLLLLHCSALSCLLSFTVFLRPRSSARGVDAWVVEVLRGGYRILFSRRPQLCDQPLSMPSYSPSSIWGKALEQEFQDLLRNQAIEPAPRAPGFFSRLFVVQKVSGAWRPIVDLSTLDTSIASQRFQMETPRSVLGSIRPGDWMISLDLQDACLQVPVHPESRRYLRFTMGGVSYQFRVLCFGLTTAPQVRAPASVRGAGTTSQSQKVVLDSISGHDLSRHADPISSVRCKTDRDKGSESPRDHRGVFFHPRPPSSSMVSSSGPPFVPYSSGEGWDVKDAISPNSPQVQVGLPRRIASHPLGSSMSGGSFMVALGDSIKRGSRFFLPSARLELLLGRVRRWLGCHRRGPPSVRSLGSKPKGILHQPQGDDGSVEGPFRVQLSPQRQDDRSLFATMSRQSLISGDWEARGLRSCSSKRG